MASWGGRRSGAGRKLNPLKSYTLAAELIERSKVLRGDAAAPTPLEYWLAILWDSSQPEARRDEAARVCMPYLHPRLQAIAINHEDDNRLVVEIKRFSGPNPVIQSGDSVALIAQPSDLDAAISAAIGDDIEAEAAD